MSPAPSLPRSTADARRATVVDRAVSVFARGGYHATSVADVAAAARISPAYVFRLFGSKQGVFIAALGRCYERVVETLDAAGEAAAGERPEAMLAAMGDAYAGLIADRDLLLLQVHALGVAGDPEVAAAMHRGYAAVVDVAARWSGAPDAAVQEFIAYGQLCHLIVAAGLDNVNAGWAQLLTAGMTHPDHVATHADRDEGGG